MWLESNIIKLLQSKVFWGDRLRCVGREAGCGGPCSHRHCDPKHSQPGFFGAMERILSRLPHHHYTGWRPLQNLEGSRMGGLWVVQPPWHWEGSWQWSMDYLLSGCFNSQLWIFDFKEDFWLHIESQTLRGQGALGIGWPADHAGLYKSFSLLFLEISLPDF